MTLSLQASPARAQPRNLTRLRNFIGTFADLLAIAGGERAILKHGSSLLSELIRHDDWLPEEYAAPDPQHHQQYLLHCDGQQRFAVVSFVWAPGQSTQIHDHTVWGLIGVLRGAELNEKFKRDESGELVATGRPERRGPGAVSAVSPTLGDVHRVSNALPDRSSISIHVYGANIGAVERASYDARGDRKRFVSGYANRTLPNLWDRA